MIHDLGAVIILPVLICFYFSCLTVLARTPNTVLNVKGKNGYLLFLSHKDLNIRHLMSLFWYFQFKYMVILNFFYVTSVSFSTLSILIPIRIFY